MILYVILWLCYVNYVFDFWFSCSDLTFEFFFISLKFSGCPTCTSDGCTVRLIRNVLCKPTHAFFSIIHTHSVMNDYPCTTNSPQPMVKWPVKDWLDYYTRQLKGNKSYHFSISHLANTCMLCLNRNTGKITSMSFPTFSHNKIPKCDILLQYCGDCIQACSSFVGSDMNDKRFSNVNWKLFIICLYFEGFHNSWFPNGYTMKKGSLIFSLYNFYYTHSLTFKPIM